MVEVKNLTKIYSSGGIVKKYKKAVDSVSFTVNQGETIGIIGGSGCGKSTLAYMMAQLLESTEGSMLVDCTDVTNIRRDKLKEFHKKVQIIFQNPESSLDPLMKIRSSIKEALRAYHIVPKKSPEEQKLVLRLAELVGLQEELLNRYPWEVSGGQIQRAVLARVLALEPSVLIADEPTSMLDVSVQAQILTLLKRMQADLKFAMIFISHDLDVVKIMSDRVIVMHEGRSVEQGTVSEVFERPSHEYTKSLINEFYYGE